MNSRWIYLWTLWWSLWWWTLNDLSAEFWLNSYWTLGWSLWLMNSLRWTLRWILVEFSMNSQMNSRWPLMNSQWTLWLVNSSMKFSFSMKFYLIFGITNFLFLMLLLFVLINPGLKDQILVCTEEQSLVSGERPYRCAVEGCSKAFRQLSSLQQHIKGHNVPLPKSYPISRVSPNTYVSPPTPTHKSSEKVRKFCSKLYFCTHCFSKLDIWSRVVIRRKYCWYHYFDSPS